MALLRDLAERRRLQYQLTSNESLGRGPLVVALDKSTSMEGAPPSGRERSSESPKPSGGRSAWSRSTAT